ncbi:hypothetical protein [Nocardia caishijiensis]|nr:hypothetical protein [Nocardia caishijiensis]
MRYLVDDIAATDLAALRKREMTPAVVVLLYVLSVAPGRTDAGERLLPLVDDISAMFAAPNGHRDLRAVVEYIMTVSETNPSSLNPLLDRLEPQVREAVVTTAEMLEVRGAAKTLLRQLDRKFGTPSEATIARVRAADMGDLERWADQILTAETVEEALA